MGSFLLEWQHCAGVRPSQNPEVGNLNDHEFHVDQEERPQRLLVDVLQTLRQKRPVPGRIVFQMTANRVSRLDHCHSANDARNPQELCGCLKRIHD